MQQMWPRHVSVTSITLKKPSLSLYVDILIVDADHVGYCWFNAGFEAQYVLFNILMHVW